MCLNGRRDRKRKENGKEEYGKVERRKMEKENVERPKGVYLEKERQIEKEEQRRRGIGENGKGKKGRRKT